MSDHKSRDKDRDRERERRRRPRRDSEDEESGISGWKLGAVVAVIVVCFAMLYPTVFHPMLMGMLGHKDPPVTATPQRPPIHPGMGGPRQGGAGRSHEHPAMRMAAAQADSQSGGGKGSFTYLLPLYTVGVVVFLLYTLFKSKSGKKKKRDRSRYDSEDESEEDERGGRFEGKLGRKKLHGLQDRLKQTEDAMSKILEQLEAVQAQGINIEALTSEQPSTSQVVPDATAASAVPERPNQQSEQYIGDLERALKEFKVLSEAYEQEKDLHLKESGGTSESELDSEETTDSELEEIAREKEREQRKRDKKKKKKVTSSKKEAVTSSEEEESDGERVERVDDASEEEEEEGQDIDAEEIEQETIIEQKKDEKDKKVRRRARKV